MSSPAPITGVVVYDPVSNSAARVDVPPRDRRGVSSVWCAMGSPLMGRTVLRLQRETLSPGLKSFEVYCDNRQAAKRMYGIYPDRGPRAGKEFIRHINFNEYYRPRTRRGPCTLVQYPIERNRMVSEGHYDQLAHL